MAGSRVQLFERIRRDHVREDLSLRALAARHHVRRDTVRQALASAVPPPRKRPVRAAPKLDPAKPLIDAMLRTDLDAPPKQRHTARRVLARLVDEHGMTALTYPSVRDYVRRRRPEIAAEAGRAAEQAFVPQLHPPGAEAEVDFADVMVDLDGVVTRCAMFTLRLSASGKAVHRVFGSWGQEAFLEGHVHAFEVLGGMPFDKIRYDNLRSAVSRVLFGRNREENERWVAFRSHYCFDAFYCQRGLDGAHEKGGVEGEGGRFRRTHLVPVPKVASLAELNAYLERCDARDDHRRIGNRSTTVGMDFTGEAPLLRPLPAERFDVGLTLTPRVDRYGQIMVRQWQYSVPVRLIGQRVRARLTASSLTVLEGRSVVAEHPRAVGKGGRTLTLDHYLEVLSRKPGALPGSVPLAQARADGSFTPAHDAFWAAARKRLGDAAGTRALIEVLLLHRHLAHADVVAGLRAAVLVGATNPDVVAVEARKAAEARGVTVPAPPEPVAPPRQERVASLTERRLADPAAVIAGLPPDTRPLPTVTAYDELLHHRGQRGAG